jgi:hypothetical protein
MRKRYLTDWLAGEKRGADRLRSLVEPEETFWTEDRMDPKEKNDPQIETGIHGELVTLRITSETGMVTTVGMDTTLARQIGAHLIGQADLIEPPGPDPIIPDKEWLEAKWEGFEPPHSSESLQDRKGRS